MSEVFFAQRLMGYYFPDASHSNHNIQYVLGSSVPVQFNAAAKKSCGDLVDLKSRRLGTKSCSDSSMDGRSSDSTYTTSSSGDRTSELDCTNGINGRFTRQSVNSRFPTMERIDLTGGSLYNVQRQSHRVQNHRQCPVMGASQYYQQHQQYNSHNLNATYPKVNYTLHAAKQPHGSQRNYHQQQSNHKNKYYGSQEAFYQESHFSENSNALDGTYTVSNGPADCATTTMIDNQANNGGNSSRRFVNVEKFIMQSNKSTTESIQSPVAATKTPPPPSNTSITNSKETAIIEVPKEQEAIVKQPVQERTKSSLSDETTLHTKEDVLQSPAQSIASAIITQQEKASYVCSTPTTTLVETIQSAPIDNDVGSVSTAKWSTEEILQIEDIVDATPSTPVTPLPLAKSEDLVRPASVQSRAESIKTQLEYSTPLSRSHSVQSAKSVVIEEELEGPVSNSISLVDSYHHDSAAHTPEEVAKVETNENVHLADTYIKDLLNNADNNEDRSFTPAVIPPRSLTSEENIPHSRKSSIAKSLESLVYEKSSFKQGSPENCTETSSESSQLNNNSVSSNYIPTKPQYTPPKRKSRTSCFLKSNRRVSPVKQSIKMSQAELFPQALTRFEKPREALNKTCDQLDSSNWEEIVVALKSMVRLMRHHPDTLDCQMHMVCIQLTKSVRNLRSQVSRAACQASTELFTIKSKFLEQECDDLVCALLHRTADTNRFLRADASRGLESMCDNLAPPKVLNILTTRGALHQNAIVRTTAAKLLTRLADRLGCEKIFTMGRENRDKFFLTGANLLLEGSLETRGYAKSLFRLLSDHHNYSRLLLEVIPTRTYRNIEKTLKSIR